MNTSVGTQTHTHTSQQQISQDPTRPRLAHIDGRHLISAHHARIYLGLPGASSESFLLDHLTFYLER